MEWEEMSMDIVLSRILKYLNGCLDNDHMYKVGLFVVHHYVEMEDYSLDKMLQVGHFTKAEVLDFCQHLGFSTYEEFQDELIADYMLPVFLKFVLVCLGFHQNNS